MRLTKRAPWYVRRKGEFDPHKSKHAGGGRRKASRKSKEARVARAVTCNWPRGRS